jgi:hypothetical protein
MQANLKINFLTGDLDDQTMSLIVLANEQIVFKQDKDLDKTFTVDFNIDLPGEIKLIVNGKGAFDTKVDAQGTILQDKFLKINSMLIDRMPVPTWVLASKLIQFVHNNQVAYTNYFGYNGQGIIQLPSNTFLLFLDLQTAG